MKPYYQQSGVTIYHGDCREVLPYIPKGLFMMDPPYGINYSSGMTGHHGGTSLPGIAGDKDTSLRDYVLRENYGVPALVFGSWKVPRPLNVRGVLIWEKGDHVGMGDLSLPWKPNIEEIYAIGDGFVGHRDSSVIRFAAPVTWNSVSRGRLHPHEKPEGLILRLLVNCRPFLLVVDPFMGSGTTLAAAKRLARHAIGIEIEERYCEIAAKRLQQEALPLEMDLTSEVR